MEKIVTIDLNKETAEVREFNFSEEKEYGRGLAVKLLSDNLSPNENPRRCGEENTLVIVPGLLTGSHVASTGRMMMAAFSDGEKLAICNITGNTPHQLASLNIAAVVFKGTCEKKDIVVKFSSEGVTFEHRPQLVGVKTDFCVKALKEEFGSKAGIVGSGIATERTYSLATIFSTYRDGNPEYSCPRNAFGDIFGSKGIKAIVVNSDGFFQRDVANEKKLEESQKKIAKIIIDNDLCGCALPAFGSMTLIDLIDGGVNWQEAKRNGHPAKKLGSNNERNNLACSPMCIVGCLNKHSSNTGIIYESPDQSETSTALKTCFGIDDAQFTKVLQGKLRQLCLASPEFVTSAKAFFEATNKSASKDELMKLVEEIEKDTDVGRIVASRAEGVANHFNKNKHLFELADVEPDVEASLFNLDAPSAFAKLGESDALELLYSQIFILENLGFCLFTSFALINNMEALEELAELACAKTGTATTPHDLIEYAKKCMSRELELQRRRLDISGVRSSEPKLNIPPFTRVLYRYFCRR